MPDTPSGQPQRPVSGPHRGPDTAGRPQDRAAQIRRARDLLENVSGLTMAQIARMVRWPGTPDGLRRAIARQVTREAPGRDNGSEAVATSGPAEPLNGGEDQFGSPDGEADEPAEPETSAPLPPEPSVSAPPAPPDPIRVELEALASAYEEALERITSLESARIAAETAREAEGVSATDITGRLAALEARPTAPDLSSPVARLEADVAELSRLVQEPKEDSDNVALRVLQLEQARDAGLLRADSLAKDTENLGRRFRAADAALRGLIDVHNVYAAHVNEAVPALISGHMALRASVDGLTKWQARADVFLASLSPPSQAKGKKQ
jgi:hypothetical protein